MIELNVEHGSRNDGLWNSALERLRTRISPQNFDMWLSPIECLETSSSKLVLRAPNSYVRLWFESNFLPTVLGEIQTISGTSFAVYLLQICPSSSTYEPSFQPAIAVPTVTGHDNPDGDLSQRTTTTTLDNFAQWRTTRIHPQPAIYL